VGFQCFTAAHPRSAQDTGFLDAAEFLYLAADGLAGFKEAIATGERGVHGTDFTFSLELN